MGEQSGNENSGPANEESILTVALQKYAHKNLGAGSDGSCTEDIRPFSPASKHPDSISTQTKNGFITSLMDAGVEKATTQKTLASLQPVSVSVLCNGILTDIL